MIEFDDLQDGERVGENIVRGSDGKYRWRYDMSLLKNPTVFILIWKIFFFIILGIFAFVMIIDAIEWGDVFEERLLSNLKFFGYFLIGMTVVTAIGYLIYAAMMGWKYCVEFEMDERGVNHAQIPAQAAKARKIGRAAMIAGAAAGSRGALGAGIAAWRTEMYSEFSKVRRVKAYPRRNLIKVNGLLEHNQVYAAKADFDFVLNYITTHCTNLK
ncbi:MAG: hypothetical protein IJQ80_07150 [Clostridia bacterium]|nr:hypothetical protein [Clostridia bacterium]